MWSKSQSLVDDFLSWDEWRVRVMHVLVSDFKVAVVGVCIYCTFVVPFAVGGWPMGLVFLSRDKWWEGSWDIHLLLRHFLLNIWQKSLLVIFRALKVHCYVCPKISKDLYAFLSSGYFILLVLARHSIELLLSPVLLGQLSHLLTECTYLSLISLVSLFSSSLLFFLFVCKSLFTIFQ